MIRMSHARGRRVTFLSAIVVAGLVLVACSNPESPTQQRPYAITISDAQAAQLATRMQQLAAASPDVAWLTDSANLAVRAGAQAQLVQVWVDGASATYYAVSLEREFTLEQFATFHVFAFDDPANPSSFLVLSGYMASSGAPPAVVSGDFGGSAMHADLLSVSGSTVTDWGASLGSATMSRGATGDACAFLAIQAGAACVLSHVQATAVIQAAGPDGGVQAHSAALVQTAVPGVLLTFP